MKQNSARLALLVLTAGLVILFLANISIGSVSIPFKEVIRALFAHSSSNADIVWQFRLPKAITCVLAGSALATGGLLMQTLFRNPMAGPDVLGLTSGSSLLVALLLMAGQYGSIMGNLIQNPWSVALAASLGGAMVFVVIIFIARYVQDNTSLLIVGLMISAATSSIVSVLQFTSQADDLQTFMIWMLGSVGSTNWSELVVLSIIISAGIVISFSLIKSLNGLLLGESYAQNLAINIKRARYLIVITTGMMVGVVTAFCGPIAFVGLAVPHLVRLILPTSNHKTLLPAVMLGGAILLLTCDVLAQLPGSTQVLPLNAITSLIGAPVVIWMVIKAKRISV
ncbi:MAG: iron ABC transporter permease [Cyclobacteriaceae bacterium]|nr:MAG: iron ABC transporter permease [Cyclobacteriaceae bacterium]